MNLEEWNNLDKHQEKEVIRDQLKMESLSKLAAIEFLKNDFYHATGIYIGNRFGELFFYVIVPPDVCHRHANKFANKTHRYYKFRYFICTIESIPFAHDLEPLEKYEGISYFSKKNIIKNT